MKYPKKSDNNMHANPKSDFEKQWNLYITTLSLLKKHIKANSKKILFSLLFLLISKFLYILSPIVFKCIVDMMHLRKESIIIIEISILYWALWTGSGVLVEAKEILFSSISRETVSSFYNTIFNRIQSIGAEKTCEVVHRMQTGVKSIERFFTFFTLYLVPLCIELLAIVTAISIFYPLKYGLILIFTITIYAIFIIKVGDTKLKLVKNIHESDATIASKLGDSIMNFELIKGFGTEKKETSKLTKYFKDYEDRTKENSTFAFLTNITQHAIISTGILVFTLSSAKDAIAEIISIGDFILLNAYMLQLNQPFKHLGLAHKEIKTSLSNIINVINILQNNEPNNELKPNTQHNNYNIDIKNVHFWYDKKNNTKGSSILEDISISIPYGTKVAILGESGSGKSTLIKLIMNTYKCNSGTILLGDKNILTLGAGSITELISFIPQDMFLFNDTIKYNITYGNDHISEMALNKIALITKIDEVIKRMPEKYETIIGEGGLKLSRGEKQKIAAARALLKANAKILIADEPTSSLDNNSAMEIENAIKSYSKNKTLILVSHKISTIKDFDTIIIMNKGQVESTGKHEELLQKSNIYKKLHDIENAQRNTHSN